MRKICTFTLLGIVLHFLPALAQPKKSVDALKIDIPLKIDGRLDEECYSKALPARDFIQLNPYNGQPAGQKSEVWFFYDQEAVYVGAMLYDTAPDSIFNLISERDRIGMSDYFGVYLDPYNKGQLAYGFFIIPSGVQTDMKAIKSDNDYEDDSWDAVWESATAITGKGWVVEMKIPFSAIRFPEVPVHTWGLNMFRNIRRYRSNNSWSFIDREISGFIQQEGELTGIRDIKPPVRLSLSPYATGYLEKNGDSKETDFIYKGGVDLKYGISESFTLDMMLVPDFGQIQSDDKELNLSPYEIFYDEKRQFFTEGTEMFNRAGIFYSRRIGAAPKFSSRAEENLGASEVVEYNPSETQLLNASKISGRSSGGWGVGVLNAMTLAANARIKDTLTGGKREVQVQPFTNYNVSVVDKSLENNSYISLINTNIAMAGDPFYANATAYDMQLKNKKETYSVTSQGGFSLRREDEKEAGYGFGFNAQRIKGKFKYGIGHFLFSDKLQINDLGYLRRNNELGSNVFTRYNIHEPFGIFNELNLYAEWSNHRVYNPWTLAGNELEGRVIAVFKNNYVAGLFSGYGSANHNYYEPHVKGRYYTSPPHYYLGTYLETDARKILRGSIDFMSIKLVNEEGKAFALNTDASLRLGQRFNLAIGTDLANSYKEYGFADKTENENTIYFSKRNVQSIENVIKSSYMLNNKMGLHLRLRHYWSGSRNLVYYQLQQDGTLIEDPGYHENKNQNYNAFTVDMRFRWIFAPGSELTLAWKNSIYNDSDWYSRDYFENLGDTWKLEQTNSISLKILYYIDYNRVRGR